MATGEGMVRLPGGNLPRTGRTQRGAEIAAVGRARRAALPVGGQLARRVQSGAITSEQAQRTAQQRQTLQAAYGPNWRQRVFGDLGYVQRTRAALANNPDSQRLQALNAQLMLRRQKMLQAARQRLGQA